MADYPDRPRFFAFKFCRLLAKQAVALDIGGDACWLLATIVMMEDAKGYKAPVTWFNDGLASVLGGSEDSLGRVRKRAVESGWLHYEPGVRSRAGKYWVTIPPQFCGGNESEESPVGDELPPQKCGGNESPEKERSAESRTQPRGNCGGNRGETAEECADPSTLIPITSQETLSLNPSQGVSPLVPRRKRPKDANGYCAAFEAFWAAYPRREGKRKAYESWKAAGGRVKASKGIDSAKAATYILERATAYGESPRGRWPMDKIPHPTTWLNQDRFDDDPKAWQAGYDEKPAGAESRPATGAEILAELYGEK